MEEEFKEIENYQGKCLILGGHQNWVKTMKDKIKNDNFEFIDFEKLKQIKNINVNQFTHIIINTQYVNHTVYNLVISKLNDKKKMNYINNKVNVNYTLQKIEEIIR